MNTKSRCAYQMKRFSLIGKMGNDLVSTEKRKRKPRFKLVIELTHEQHWFELCGSIYMWIFFILLQMCFP